jgi:hypothetical protein
MHNHLDPYGIFAWPFSGNVSQRISTPWFSPAVTVNYAGDAAIEQRVVSDIASYGKQLGWLNEIVLAMVDNRAPPPATLAKLKSAMREIEDIKRERQQSRLKKANDALDQLEHEDPHAYIALLQRRLP